MADAIGGLRIIQTSSEIETLPLTEPNRTSYTDYTAVPGVTYAYSVAAFDSINGTLGYSAPAEDLGRRVLMAPTSVVASKGESESQVQIMWRDNSDAEDGYRIYRDGDSIATVADNEISFVDVSPTFGQHHFYEVRAIRRLRGVRRPRPTRATRPSSAPGRSTRRISTRTASS